MDKSQLFTIGGILVGIFGVGLICYEIKKIRELRIRNAKIKYFKEMEVAKAEVREFLKQKQIEKREREQRIIIGEENVFGDAFEDQNELFWRFHKKGEELMEWAYRERLRVEVADFVEKQPDIINQPYFIEWMNECEAMHPGLLEQLGVIPELNQID